MQSAREFRKNLLLLLSSVFFALFLSEMILRSFFPPVQQDSLFPPGQQFQLTPDPLIFPGLTGKARYKVNALGFRGSDPSATAYALLALGGSTTECLYLDQEKTWPALLEQLLNQKQPIWLGNFSKSGLHSGHHLLQWQWMRQQPALQQVRLVYCLTGFNDLIHFLGNDSLYLSNQEEEQYRFAFPFKSDLKLPWIKRFSLWKAVAAFRNSSDTLHQQDTEGSHYRTWRKYRMQDTAKLTELPDLQPAIDLYVSRIDSMLHYAAEQHITLVFITQPVCWNSPAVPEDEPWFWLGKKGDFADPSTGHYYTTEALYAGMNRFNEALRSTVSRHNGRLADLAAVLPRNRTVFYDDCHFTEAGSRMVANFLYQYTDSLQLMKWSFQR